MPRPDQERYINNSLKVLEDANNMFGQYINVYGPNGRMPRVDFENSKEYSDIKIDINEIMEGMEFDTPEEEKTFKDRIKRELDPAVIAAIVLGACMNPSRLSKNMSSSSTRGDMTGANQMRLTDDVMRGDPRTFNFGPVMLEGRKEAASAIRYYILDNDPDLIKKYLQNLVDYTVKESGEAIAAQTGNSADVGPQKVAYMLGHEMMERKAFGVTPNKKEDIGIIRSESYKKQFNSMVAGENSKLALINNFENLSADEKDILITDMLFNSYIANMGRIQNEERNNTKELYALPYLDKLGCNIDEKEMEEGKLFSDDLKLKSIIEEQMPVVVNKHTVSNFDAILAKPDGERRLRELYTDAIKKSDVYKKIMKSKTQEQLIDNIMASDRDISKGITSIKSVKLPNEAKKINDAHKKEFEDQMNQLCESMYDHITESPELLAGDAKKYGFTDMTPAGLEKNAKIISDIYDVIEKNNSRGGSRNNNYKNMMDKLKELRDFSRRIAKGKKPMSATQYASYTKLAGEVDKLALHYLDNKTNINSTYARNRVSGVKELRGILKMNLKPAENTINTLQDKITSEYLGSVYKTYNETDPWRDDNNPFYGTKYINESSRRYKTSYSAGRAAGISVTIFAMAASGKYSFEDIMDSNKLHEEKQKVFDEVIKKMNNMTPENQQWIAKQIYEGQKATENMINEQAKLVDFSKPDVLQDRRLCQMLHMAFHQFDCWQEMKHCSDEIVALANKDHPEITTYTQYKDWWTARDTALTTLNEAISKQRKNAYNLLTDKNGLQTNAAQTACSTEAIKKTLSDLAAAQKAGGDKPFMEWITQEQKFENIVISSGIGQKPYMDKFEFLDESPGMAKAIAPMLVNGSLLKDATLKLDMVNGRATLVGAPTEEEIRNKLITVANEKYLKNTDEAIERLGNKNYKYTSKEEFINDAAYALFGQMYRVSKGKSPIDVQTGERVTLEDYTAKMVTNKDFINSLKSKENPKNFMSPKSIADTAVNNEKIKSIIAESNRQYEQKMALEAQKTAKNKKTVKKEQPQKGMHN